jgi:hypothetical protein
MFKIFNPLEYLEPGLPIWNAGLINNIPVQTAGPTGSDIMIYDQAQNIWAYTGYSNSSFTGTSLTGPTGPAGSGDTPPATSRTIYMAKYGNDTTNNGSLSAPFLSLAKCADVANSLSSTSDPVVIYINSGTYTEDNSGSPITFTAGGISVVGVAASSVFIYPNTLSNVLISTTTGVQFNNITFDILSGTSTSTCLDCSGIVNTTNMYNCRIFNYNTGINFAGSFSSYLLQDCVIRTCTTHINIANNVLVLNNLSIQGSATAVPAGVGIVASGSSASLLVNGGLWVRCTTCLSISDNAVFTADSILFRNNKYDIVASSSSLVILVGGNFTFGSSSDDITIIASDAGTIIRLNACYFSGRNLTSGLNQGTCIKTVNGGSIEVASSLLVNFETGCICGDSSSTSSTNLEIDSIDFQDCDADITQFGTSTLTLTNSHVTTSKLSFANSTNIKLNYIEKTSNNLSLGTLSDTKTSIFDVMTGQAEFPNLTYTPNIYNADSFVFSNPYEPSSLMMKGASFDTSLICSVTDRTKSASLSLYSDTGGTFGGTGALRGWTISKTGTSASLIHKYFNSDLSGQTATGVDLLSLDAVNNIVSLPNIGTQLTFTTDTNLYRNSAGVLKSDGDLILNGLTNSTALVSNASNKITSSSVTSTELGYLSGATSSVQNQLNGKVSSGGGTMTGALQLPNGSSSLPSLNFAGSSTSGLSLTGTSLQLNTLGVERMKLNSNGVYVSNAGTGVAHFNTDGLLSSSLIVNADITNSTITNAKLATVSSTNDSSYIVARDGSGNFATNMITIAGTTTNSTDVATKSYVDSIAVSSIVPLPPAVVVATSNVALSGLQTIDGYTLLSTNRVLLVNQTSAIQNGVWIASAGSWSRPTDSGDFKTGQAVGSAYVLVTNGDTQAGSAYLCSTPNAIVGTDSITMIIFTLASSVSSASNLSGGEGLLYSGKSGSVLEFRSLQQGTGINLTTNTNVVEIKTNATPLNTASTIVYRDASGNFSAGTVTANLTGNASGNVLKSGDTMSGNLVIPAGSTNAPSLNFTGSTTSGLSASSDTISISTAGNARLQIDPSGNVKLNTLSTGVVHSDASGNLTSSSVTNSDIKEAAGISDTKLATITSAGKVSNSATTAISGLGANTIVLRDASFNFSAGTITADLVGIVTGSASDNVLKSGDIMTGRLQVPAGSTVSPSLNFTASTGSGLSASSEALSFSTNSSERMKIDSAGVVSINGFTVAGVVHNDGSGILTSSTIVNADISASANITDSKLATISTAGKVSNSATTATNVNTASTIVARDSGGGFNAGVVGMSGCNVVGNISATGNFSVAGVSTMTGSLVVYGNINTIGSVNITGNVGITGGSLNIYGLNSIGSMNITGNVGITGGSFIGNLIGNASTVTTNANITGAISSIGNVSVLNYMEASSAVTSGTVTTADTLITSMSLSPGPGTYLCYFSSTATPNNNTASSIFVTIYVNGSPIATTVRSMVASSSANGVFIGTQGVITVVDSQLVEIYGRRSTATATFGVRGMQLIRLA